MSKQAKVVFLTAALLFLGACGGGAAARSRVPAVWAGPAFKSCPMA